MRARTAIVLLAAATLLACALSTGAGVYYLLFFFLLALLLLALASALGTLLTLRVDVRGVRARAVRGEAVPLIVTARHLCPLPVADVRLIFAMPEDDLGANTITAFLPPFARREFRFVMRCPHRGVYEAGMDRAVVSDIFGLVELRRHLRAQKVRVEILPRARDMEALELRAGETGPESRSRAAEDASSPSGVRAWQDGDVLKKVHWKLTMRRREVLVRTYEESARPDTLILPDLSPINALKDQALTIEDCVCEICLGAARAQLLNSDPVSMPLTCAIPSESAGRSIAELPGFQTALARATFDSPYSYEQVLSSMYRRMQRTGGVVLVTARLTMRIADAAVRMRQMGITVNVFWVSDAQRDEALALTARLKLAGVGARVINPWTAEESA